MKKALFPVVALVLSTFSAHLVNAAPAPGPKRPGPSAVEAARLKKNPPPNYLAHYLPDDRYKIAGGVWKYVSTDLDTYYHIPSSPNMLRQPANRVIGFANARDAEEAGYVADPTDGTANKAAATTSSDISGQNTNPEELRYLNRLLPILRASGQDTQNFIQNMQRVAAPGFVVSNAERQEMAQEIKQRRRFSAQINALKAPPRYARFQSLLVRAFREGVTSMQRLQRVMNTGDLSQLQGNLAGSLRLQLEIVQEAQRLGISPSSLR